MTYFSFQRRILLLQSLINIHFEIGKHEPCYALSFYERAIMLPEPHFS